MGCIKSASNNVCHFISSEAALLISRLLCKGRELPKEASLAYFAVQNGFLQHLPDQTVQRAHNSQKGMLTSLTLLVLVRRGIRALVS